MALGYSVGWVVPGSTLMTLQRSIPNRYHVFVMPFILFCRFLKQMDAFVLFTYLKHIASVSPQRIKASDNELITGPQELNDCPKFHAPLLRAARPTRIELGHTLQLLAY